jgi:hypothetical protein
LTGPDVPSMRFKKAEDERKLASALIVFSAFRVSNTPRIGDRSKPCRRPLGGVLFYV